MVGELIMLPVRVGVRATRLWFRAVEESVSITSSAAGRVIELLASRSSDGAGGEASSRDAGLAVASPPVGEGELRTSPDGRAPAPARPSRPPRRNLRPAPAPAAAPPREPAHVSEEPELVEEFAEPGVEQGAGAEVHVNPPWDGYKQMTAKQVVSRLADADSAELAAVQLYEGSTRDRQTIMNAVQRELRIANSSSSRTSPRRRTNQRG